MLRTTRVYIYYMNVVGCIYTHTHAIQENIILYCSYICIYVNVIHIFIFSREVGR